MQFYVNPALVLAVSYAAVCVTVSALTQRSM
jgi:hypothetical protein